MTHNIGEQVVALGNAGRYQEIVDLCRAEIKNDPTNLYPRIQLGIALAKLKRQSEAHVVFSEIIDAAGGTSNIPPPMLETMKHHGYNP